MEDEVKTGIEKFRAECERKRPGVVLVIPVRPTQGAFLVSFTHSGMRTYGTIQEDQFADWGEATGVPEELQKTVELYLQKL
jgi:hypothetical protein